MPGWLCKGIAARGGRTKTPRAAAESSATSRYEIFGSCFDFSLPSSSFSSSSFSLFSAPSSSRDSLPRASKDEDAEEEPEEEPEPEPETAAVPGSTSPSSERGTLRIRSRSVTSSAAEGSLPLPGEKTVLAASHSEESVDGFVVADAGAEEEPPAPAPFGGEVVVAAVVVVVIIVVRGGECRFAPLAAAVALGFSAAAAALSAAAFSAAAAPAAKCDAACKDGWWLRWPCAPPRGERGGGGAAEGEEEVEESGGGGGGGGRGDVANSSAATTPLVVVIIIALVARGGEAAGSGDIPGRGSGSLFFLVCLARARPRGPKRSGGQKRDPRAEIGKKRKNGALSPKRPMAVARR